mmetsp:Transcript_1138/g.2694  ORF Transcript_1138/g.2694 Transcript_1138/m.2694 type:complete len:254 (+) Transcript_1138:1643-2404(+)
MASSTSSIPRPTFADTFRMFVQSSPMMSSISLMTRSGSAPGRSILLSTGMTSRSFSSASHTLANVCASTPWLASTTSKAPSQAASDRDTSYAKSTCPGVSMRFSAYSSPLLSVYLMRAEFSLMVIPRSRSMSLLSMNCSTMSRAATVLVLRSSWSANVDLPWSMWAMMLKFLIFFTGTFVHCPAAYLAPGPPAGRAPSLGTVGAGAARHTCGAVRFVVRLRGRALCAQLAVAKSAIKTLVQNTLSQPDTNQCF